MSALVAKVEEVQRLVSSGQAARALPLAQRLLQQHPRSPDIVALMSMVCTELGQFERAEHFSRQALTLAPDDVPLMLALAQRLSIVRKHGEAVSLARRAVEMRPDDAAAAAQLVHASTAAGLAEESYRAGLRAMTLAPGDPEMVLATATALVNLSRVADAVTLLSEGMSRFPNHARLAAGYASTLNYDGRTSPEQSLSAHHHWARLVSALPTLPVAPAPRPTPADADRRITVGVLSSDLRRHSVAYFLERWAEHHDRATTRLVGLQLNHLADEFTKRLRTSFDGWVDLSRTDGLELAQGIRKEKIDVLVECNGLTEGQRLAVLACRPAPVQVSYCGYPNTLTLPWIDGRIVDALTDPPELEARTTAENPRPTEPLYRIDPCFLCYTPPPSKEVPEPAVPPMMRAANGGIANDGGRIPPTFGSFNAVQKLSDRCLALWGRVLSACPGSRLVVKAMNLRDDSTRAALSARMAAAGLDPSRVDLLGPVEASEGHLASYARIDIALDTMPYNGTTTTCEALWMGVPVVVLAGRMHHERVGVSLLSAVGMPELIAKDEDGFVRIACGLAADVAGLASMRAGLRARIAASALCDGKRFAAGMERALREAWRRAATGA